jgi:drug/metabolite transporter (DMT)-like permease
MRPIVFALLTGLFWGCYGPTLANARAELHSPFKPYVAVGVAYLIVGILGGLVGMKINNEAYNFNGPGFWWGLGAGTLGALGALCLTFAMFSGGGKFPHVVMSTVFGGATTVAALVSVAQLRGQVEFKPGLWIGILGMFACTILVAYNTPHAGPHKPPAKSPSEQAATPESPTSGKQPS